jgi:mono/diheme cytochrome c family protein
VTAQVKVQKKPIPYTTANDGRQMYLTYCAACHGQDGKGNGPAASALKRQPADLTRLSAENGGRYPTTRVTNVLRNGSPLSAHGSSDMPVWGPLFQSLSASQAAQNTEIQLRMNLNPA